MLVDRHPMPKRLVESMESPCISCRKIAYLTIYRSHIGNYANLHLIVLLYNQWIRQDHCKPTLMIEKTTQEQNIAKYSNTKGKCATFNRKKQEDIVPL